MSFAIIIWMIGTLPAVAKSMCFLFFILMAIAAVTYAISAITLSVERNTEEEEIKLTKINNKARNAAIAFCLIWFMFLIVPDKETAYAMAAGYGVQSVAQNERVQKIAGQGVDVLETFLEKTKKELEKK